MSDTTLVEQPARSESTDQSLQAMTYTAVKAHINLIQQLMKGEMEEGTHYMVIPGTEKKDDKGKDISKRVLVKAGAEKLNLMFRLAPRFEIVTVELGNGHREYRIRTSLFHIDSGKFIGEGLGSCSTMEKKYRWRGGEGEDTGRFVPKEYWDIRKEDPEKAQTLLGGAGYVTKKVDAAWKIFKKSDEKIENPDIADTYNTVLKMAKKRSHVDATLSATAASDIFTQDLEENIDPGQPAAKPVVKKTVDGPTVAQEHGGGLTEDQRKKFWGQFKRLVADEAVQKSIIKDVRGQESTAGMTIDEADKLMQLAEEWFKQLPTKEAK